MEVFKTHFDGPVCDFCSIPETVEDFKAPLITALAMNHGQVMEGVNYDDTWAACSGCAKLIHARDMDGLLARVKATEDILVPELPGEEYLDQLRVIYTAIFETLNLSENRVH